MRNQLTNPYFAALLVPLAFFTFFIWLGVGADPISLTGRLVAFGLYAYIGARYVGTAPMLVWQKDFRAQARNVVGWAIAIVSAMATILYGWLFIAYGRPEWLSSTYWNPGFIILLCVGLAFVASSVPKVGPFPKGPPAMSVLGSIFIASLGTLGMFVLGHLPQAIVVAKSVWSGILGSLVHAF